MSAEDSRIPKMQNPGVPAIVSEEEAQNFGGKRVTLLPVPILGVTVEIAWPPRILRSPRISDADEAAALADTTYE